MRKFIFFSTIIFSCISLSAQQYEDFGFQRDLSVKVKDSLQNYLKNPWAGGLNSCQFSQIDLNMDGIKDLFIFDRNSSKIITFLNNGTAGTVDYTYAPQYIRCFPVFHDWVILLDYNGDGLEDIFTYGSGGIAVYNNISAGSSYPEFAFVTDMIKSQQGPNHTNILVTSVEFPGIADMDNDGDIDILTFFGLGSYIVFHRNMSMELYGVPDSLKFDLYEYCWGKIAESPADNKISLNITCPYKSGADIGGNGAKHTGSTMLATDLNGDGLKDLLLADVGYPGIIKLTNGGTLTDAFIISQDTLFPSNSLSVNLISMPVPALIDVNNDGKKDLIVSPFEGGSNVSENLKSCWYYKNSGTNNIPVFDYQYNNFLQKEMIETGAGAYPVLYDYNADGLPDLFIGNYGIRDSSYYYYGNLTSTYTSRIALYKNTGTAASPEFSFVTNDFADISQRKLNGVIPAFGDIDGDGVSEMIIGKSDGSLDYYENSAGYGEPMNMTLSQQNYQNINVGKFSAPQLTDLDGDALPDLVIGEMKGNLNYYRNTGSAANPQFSLITDSLGGVDVVKHNISNYGYSAPCFFRDSANHLKLFVGSESGNIYYYKNIENNLTGHFTLEDSVFLYIYDGSRCGVAVGNLNGDNFPDMITGNFSGGVSYYKGVFPPVSGISEYYTNDEINFVVFPNPADDKLFIKLPGNFLKEKTGLKIYNMLGEPVYRNIIYEGGKININLAGMSEGIYFISLSMNDNITGKEKHGKGKFIVMH